MATLDGVLYAVGGSDGIAALNQVFFNLLDFHFSLLSGFNKFYAFLFLSYVTVSQS